MKYTVLLLYNVGLLFIGTVCSEEINPEVEVEQGTLRGEVLTSKAGGSYFSFKGIPYAKPPVGDLRFVDAQPAEPWDGVHEASREGDRCPQLQMGTTTVLGVEDCLYLNVYSPQLPEINDTDTLLPVMFWIHGGGFVIGTSHSSQFGPDHLVSEGVVVVTINYRLGPFGFFFMKEAAPGNVGMKDQVAALRWVKKNIQAFGGDPNLVTIFGESAGGASVHLHMLSPLSAGLFHRAISQSGSAINPWAFQLKPEEKSRRLGNALGCDQEDPQAFVACVREADVAAILNATSVAVPTEEDRGRLANFIFVPSLEYTVHGVEKFLPGLPERLTKAGLFSKVPYMTGANSQEGLMIWTPNLLNETVLSDIDSKWEENVWPELRLCSENPNQEAALCAIRDFYYGGGSLTPDSLQNFLDLYSDLLFFEGISYTVNLMTKFCGSPLYEYNLIVDDELNFFKVSFNVDWPGTSHADDLGYIFHPSSLPEVAEDSSAALARRRVVRLWTNFAKYGKPTHGYDPLINVDWKECTKSACHYLEIGQNLTLRKNLYKDRVRFWKKFYGKYAM